MADQSEYEYEDVVSVTVTPRAFLKALGKGRAHILLVSSRIRGGTRTQYGILKSCDDESFTFDTDQNCTAIIQFENIISIREVELVKIIGFMNDEKDLRERAGL